MAVSKHVSKGVPQQAEVAHGVPGRLGPWIFLTFRHYNGGSSSTKRTGRLYPSRNTWYSFSEAESTSGHMVLLGYHGKNSPVTPFLPQEKSLVLKVETFLLPTDAHNVKKHRVIKTF